MRVNFFVPGDAIINRDYDSKPSSVEEKVRALNSWWSRGELNSCPRKIPLRHLQFSQCLDLTYQKDKNKVR